MAFFHCKNCPAREPGCHSWCEDYLEAKKEHEAAKAYLKDSTAIDNYNIEKWNRLRENYRRRTGDTCRRRRGDHE